MGTRRVVFIVAFATIGCGQGGSNSGRLAIGQPASPIATRTLDDSEFRLHDLRGKVVVLNFWATWCTPCRAMIPHERELVKRLADKPFAFVGISADASAERLRDFVREERMSWTHLLDGDDGPISQLYDVAYFPTIFVLDAKGIIRYKDVRERELERAVEKLLAEIGH